MRASRLKRRSVKRMRLLFVLLIAGCAYVPRAVTLRCGEIDPGMPIASIGTFSDIEATEEHEYGYAVHLWQAGPCIFGLFDSAEGLIGDTPTGLLEKVEWQPSTRRLSFQARLTSGWEGPNDPAEDLFEFRGRLETNEVKGRLRHFNAKHVPGRQTFEEDVILIREPAAFYESPRTYAEWREMVTPVLKFRGPQW